MVAVTQADCSSHFWSSTVASLAGVECVFSSCNESFWRPFVTDAVKYLISLKLNGQPLHESVRKTAVLGLVMTATSGLVWWPCQIGTNVISCHVPSKSGPYQTHLQCGSGPKALEQQSYCCSVLCCLSNASYKASHPSKCYWQCSCTVRSRNVTRCCCCELWRHVIQHAVQLKFYLDTSSVVLM